MEWSKLCTYFESSNPTGRATESSTAANIPTNTVSTTTTTNFHATTNKLSADHLSDNSNNNWAYFLPSRRG